MKPISETHPSLIELNMLEIGTYGPLHKACLSKYVQKHTVDKQVLRDCLYSCDLLEGIDIETVKEIKRELGLYEE